MGKRLFYRPDGQPSMLCKPSLSPLFNARFSCIFPATYRLSFHGMTHDS
nr:MAG TPA_asm: hypothetical protein [Caudoviricetes sp.]